MNTNHLFTSMLAVSALLVTSCSTSKLAKNNAIQDDVYNTTAQAKEYKEAAPVEQIAQTDQRTDDYYGTSDPYYDMDYATRINRFYYANPWRTYYDGYYGYSPFGFNNFYSPFYGNAFGWNDGYYNNFYNSYNYWGYYGAPYYNNYWGLYSYYNPYLWGGGYYGGGGGYYGNIGGGIRNSANYGPRPTRGSENGINRANGSSYTGGSNGIGDRVSSAGSRAERYNPTNGSTAGRPSGTTTSSTPTRSTERDSRPTRSNDAPSRPTYTPPVQSSPPPSSSSSGSRGGSSGSSSSGSSSGGGRPTRGGGR
ncbi:hypothetical protein WG904_12900 [Pedobacter sp. Du54]|uniref:hypothetical protein n=1 Tax=Pedobacter anseongensis TaxID=3133439 RepID=UPI0030B20C1D